MYLVDSGGAFPAHAGQSVPEIGHWDVSSVTKHECPEMASLVAAVLGSVPLVGLRPMRAMNRSSSKAMAPFSSQSPLVKAATGEVVTAEDLGGAEVHTAQSGVADHFAEDEPEALHGSKRPRNIGPRELAPAALQEPEPPAHDVEDLLGLIPSDNRTPIDVREIISRIVDGSRFHEFKSRYGTTLVCGFAHIHGHKVGIVANNGILFSESSLKGAHF